ncbi:hypothetical protein SAMN05421743_10654 [Thalassobacillus cyri]|uniref:DUF309 domain-containing protein n=1 Tax=Thalassobacillus cyri TaxID=571932 RepID=A0A1H4CH71_9BACI|nr:DUF309 domain-containing protein [Thalassobacillus cyri]SEA59690.1 hypothetical protein SAMN05421743_10654 [Thalassobacillus cyri]
MYYPKAYVEFLAHFNGTKDFFECHEVLEAYWKETAPGQRDSIWVWMIQLAVSLYHYRRGNYKGASKLVSRLQNNWAAHQHELDTLGLEPESLFDIITQLDAALKHRTPYQNINLPIKDPGLILSVKDTCSEWQVPYNREKEPCDYYLIHKHKLRNQSGNNQERLHTENVYK